MAAPDVSPALVTQFSSMVHHEAQQTKSRLQSICKTMVLTGDDAAYEGLGPVSATLQNTSFSPIVHADIEHYRRKIERNRYYIALPIDDKDKLGMIIDPNSEYHKAVAAEMNRVRDRVIAAAALASVKTGRNFGTTVTAADDGVKTVDATAGLTYEKLLELEKNFIDAEVGNESPVRKIIALTGNEHNDLMQENELTSGDYTRQFAVEKGELQRASAFDILKFGGAGANPILAVDTGVRKCLAVAQGGIVLGTSMEVSIKVQERTDLLNTWQIVASFIVGATRTEGKLVQQLNTTVPA